MTGSLDIVQTRKCHADANEKENVVPTLTPTGSAPKSICPFLEGVGGEHKTRHFEISLYAL